MRKEEEEEGWLERQRGERDILTQGHDRAKASRCQSVQPMLKTTSSSKKKKRKRGWAGWQKLSEDFCVWVCLLRCPLSASHWNSGQIQSPRLLTHFWKHHTPSFLPVGLQCRAWLTIKRERVRWRKGGWEGGRHYRGHRSVFVLATSNLNEVVLDDNVEFLRFVFGCVNELEGCQAWHCGWLNSSFTCVEYKEKRRLNVIDSQIKTFE